MRWRAAAMAAVFVVVLGSTAACSSHGDKNASTDSSSAEKSAVAPETTEGKTTTTTLGPPPPAGSIPFVDPFTSSTGTAPAGSGCTPQTTGLPDGSWFGQLKAVDTGAGTVAFDLECMFVGDAANAAASADGQTEIPVPNDVYVRNESPTVRTVHAVSDVAVGLLQNDGGSAQFEPTQQGLSSAGPALGHPVWLQVQDGWVIAIQQQYFP